MELVEAKALKSSVRRELGVRGTTQHALLLDDFNSSNGGAPPEDFSVDCFLDFSNPELGIGSVEFEEEEEKAASCDVSTASPQDGPADDDNFSDEPSLPVDDYVVAGLEWVSHFVDDSSSSPVIHAYSPVDKPKNLGKCSEPEPEPEPVFVETPGLPSAVPAKARTKRSKPNANGSLWSGFSSPMSYVETEQGKKPKRKPRVQADGGNQYQLQRRCSHCQVQKTPQWRTGPLGPKTLCNACGVRYKSGRLYPEYRPACSPSFSGDVHSNSHRKVLEIRKKKESGSGSEGWKLTSTTSIN